MTLDPHAAITIRRRIEWIDTDAAGIYHWTTALRLAEAAEAALHTRLGIEGRTFGVTPRVSVSFDFRRSLRFNDLVDVHLRVDAVGRTSVRYSVSISGLDGVAAEGAITARLVDGAAGRPVAWPEDLRRLLTGAGEQEG